VHRLVLQVCVSFILDQHAREYCLCTNVQEVQQREEIVARKEAVLAEKRELEMKKLRSSQVLNKVRHLSDCVVVALTVTGKL